MRPRQWVHLIATYDSQESKAQVYLDGHLVKEVDGTGYLSQDWGHFAGIGKHYYENRYFSGAVDELTMFNYALPSDEIEYVHRGQCNNDPSIKWQSIFHFHFGNCTISRWLSERNTKSTFIFDKLKVKYSNVYRTFVYCTDEFLESKSFVENFFKTCF